MKLKLYYVAYKHAGTDLLDMISGPHSSYMIALNELKSMSVDDKNLIIVFNESEVTKA